MVITHLPTWFASPVNIWWLPPRKIGIRRENHLRTPIFRPLFPLPRFVGMGDGWAITWYEQIRRDSGCWEIFAGKHLCGSVHNLTIYHKYFFIFRQGQGCQPLLLASYCWNLRVQFYYRYAETICWFWTIMDVIDGYFPIFPCIFIHDSFPMGLIFTHQLFWEIVD